ncbi:MAG: hypothetical protein K0R57_6116 [Paenibacillaceae bacterium]|nr:hypothetical protein [Paenibacillaceae bacterium]
MFSFLFKIIVYPLALRLSAALFDGLEFGSWFQIILLGLVLAGVGTLVEQVFLRPGMLWFNTVLDWPLFTMLISILAAYLRNATVTLISAVSAGLLLTFIEYALHRYLISQELKHLPPAS